MKGLIILFDLDGTLIDSTDAILESFEYSFEKKEFFFQGNTEDIKNLIGYPLDIMYEKLGVQEKQINEFVQIYKERYREISTGMTTLLDNAKEAIELASKYARLGVVTTKTTNYSIPLLENMELMQYFECIVGRQEVENPKPHPEPILKAMDIMEVSTNNYDIYMIGDTKLDLIAAREAKIKSVAVLCGYGKIEELSQYTNHIEVNSLQAVKRIINLIK